MELTDEAYNAVANYFSILSHIGYKAYKEVDSLIVFTFIEELLYGPLSEYITEEDYKLINDALYCLYGTCIIPFPEYKESYTSIVNRMPKEYRITESGVLRGTEYYELRTKS